MFAFMTIQITYEPKSLASCFLTPAFVLIIDQYNLKYCFFFFFFFGDSFL